MRGNSASRHVHEVTCSCFFILSLPSFSAGVLERSWDNENFWSPQHRETARGLHEGRTQLHHHGADDTRYGTTPPACHLSPLSTPPLYFVCVCGFPFSYATVSNVNTMVNFALYRWFEEFFIGQATVRKPTLQRGEKFEGNPLRSCPTFFPSPNQIFVILSSFFFCLASEGTYKKIYHTDDDDDDDDDEVDNNDDHDGGYDDGDGGGAWWWWAWRLKRNSHKAAGSVLGGRRGPHSADSHVFGHCVGSGVPGGAEASPPVRPPGRLRKHRAP